MDVGLVGNVVAVSKTQINRPDEASIKTSILHHCLESASFWDDLLQRKVFNFVSKKKICRMFSQWKFKLQSC